MFYKRDGTQINIWEWEKLLPDKKYKRVMFTKISKTKIVISTVWVGINHNFGEGEPLIFESRVFDKGHKGHEFTALECMRYSTEEQARIGHQQLVDWWKVHKRKNELSIIYYYNRLFGGSK